MKKSQMDIMWEELKHFFISVRCQGIEKNKAFDMWSKYQIDLMHRVGEEDEI